MKKTDVVVGWILMVVSTLVGFGFVLGPGISALPEEESSMYVLLRSAENSSVALKETPVMITLLKDGIIVQQKESGIGRGEEFYHLVAGTYDVRLEGDGMKTLVKRGIQAIAGHRTDITGGPLQAGTGVKIVEYANGGLSREEVAARLAKLDSEVAELEKAKQDKVPGK